VTTSLDVGFVSAEGVGDEGVGVLLEIALQACQSRWLIVRRMSCRMLLLKKSSRVCARAVVDTLTHMDRATTMGPRERRVSGMCGNILRV